MKLALVAIACLVLGYVAGVRYQFHPASGDDTAILEVLADENASLREQIEVQKKLIQALEAERKELYELWGAENVGFTYGVKAIRSV
jgi:hypothetical protein